MAGIIRKLIAPCGDLCLICKEASAATDAAHRLPLCRRCASQVPWIRPGDIRCRRCGRHGECADCPRRSRPQIESNRSSVRYDSVMKDWLGRFKYRGDERLLPLFAGMLAGTFDRLLDEYRLRRKDIALITSVPLSAQRLEERGFNQADLFARALAALRRLPALPVLRRVRHTGKQSYKKRSDRMRDLTGAFEPEIAAARRITAFPSPVIVLVDDVYTTGSTLHECARTIRRISPSARIFGLTWAR